MDGGGIGRLTVDLVFAVEQSPDLADKADWQAAAVSEQVVTEDTAIRVIRASVAGPLADRLLLRSQVSGLPQ